MFHDTSEVAWNFDKLRCAHQELIASLTLWKRWNNEKCVRDLEINQRSTKRNIRKSTCLKLILTSWRWRAGNVSVWITNGMNESQSALCPNVLNFECVRWNRSSARCCWWRRRCWCQAAGCRHSTRRWWRQTRWPRRDAWRRSFGRNTVVTESVSEFLNLKKVFQVRGRTVTGLDA